VNVPASAAMKQVTMTVNVKVTGLRVLRVRLWVACRLIRLAALAGGFGIRFEEQS